LPLELKAEPNDEHRQYKVYEKAECKPTHRKPKGKIVNKIRKGAEYKNAGNKPQRKIFPPSRPYTKQQFSPKHKLGIVHKKDEYLLTYSIKQFHKLYLCPK
jgi:hypothetical protein